MKKHGLDGADNADPLRGDPGRGADPPVAAQDWLCGWCGAANPNTRLRGQLTLAHCLTCYKARPFMCEIGVSGKIGAASAQARSEGL